MSAHWRDKLRTLRDRLFGAQSPQQGETSVGNPAPERAAPETRPDIPATGARKQPVREQPAVAVNFGIDFGTSFTKVCFRDVGTEESGIVAFGAEQASGHLLPTIVAIDNAGKLFCGDEVPSGRPVTRIPYLKMRLAGANFGSTLPATAGVDLNDPLAVRALSSWFLARVLQRSQQWIARHQRDRLKNRRPVWSANVGVPVEHYDSDALEVFRQVLAMAWLWVKTDRLPATLDDLLRASHSAVPELEAEIPDFHAVPEIAAAVQSFVMSRQAEPGIYVYFDIGGGTIDGVAFNFINDRGERRINFYSGKVSPLGLSALAGALDRDAGHQVDAETLDRLLTDAAPSSKESFAAKIQLLVAEVIVTAKRKDGRNWIGDSVQARRHQRKFIGSPDPSRIAPLIVFLGGGGARAKWYQTAISSTHKDFNHKNGGIPPYKLVEVPKPVDLAMSTLHEDEFRRFAISYGLSIPFGEGPDIGLPSQFAEAERPSAWRPPGLIDYADSKDVYD